MEYIMSEHQQYMIGAQTRAYWYKVKLFSAVLVELDYVAYKWGWGVGAMKYINNKALFLFSQKYWQHDLELALEHHNSTAP